MALLIRIRNFVRAVRFVLKNGTDSVLYDGKTGLLAYNEVFKEMAFKVLATAMRSKAPVSLLMADMDGLKEINDTKGHQKGDELLWLSADVIKGCLRGSDIAGRYGGDEFIIVLPGTDKAGACVVIEKLKVLLEANSLKWSFGVAQAYFPEESELSGCSRKNLEKGWLVFLENLIAEADEDMYRDKAKRKEKPQSGT